ncbi:uroporphyrinogen-III synthase, partial [Halorubrum sp. SD626R]|uniref:uroporphyrinogen-III synthase n=1 Tax=Halorubrum sp. SD626R TaxID=1419722 RepID=UPI00113375DB
MSDGDTSDTPGDGDDAPEVGDAPRPRVAVFRPADERIDDAAALLESLGAEPVADPMLAVEPTGAVPREAPFVVLTSKTGVELAAEAGWDPGDATLAVIGPATADAAREAGWTVDVVPDEYTSAEPVQEHVATVVRTRDLDALARHAVGERVEVARSD